MSKYNVLVQMTKKIGKASRWIRVDAENPKVAMILAENQAKSSSSVVTALATEARTAK